jgi:hypothetical protein
MNLDNKSVLMFAAGAISAVAGTIVAYASSDDKVLVSKKKFCDSYDRAKNGSDYFADSAKE